MQRISNKILKFIQINFPIFDNKKNIIKTRKSFYEK